MRDVHDRVDDSVLILVQPVDENRHPALLQEHLTDLSHPYSRAFFGDARVGESEVSVTEDDLRAGCIPRLVLSLWSVLVPFGADSVEVILLLLRELVPQG